MARKLRASDLPPVQLLRRIEEIDPGVMGRVDALPREIIDGVDYLPLTSIRAVTRIGQIDMDDLASVHALAAWRRHKVVYRFSAELADEIISGDSADDIDVSVLRSLPYDGLYMDTTTVSDMVGVFVTRTVLPPSSPGLILLLLYPNGDFVSLPLYTRPGWTISRCVNHFVRRAENAVICGAPTVSPSDDCIPQTLAFLRWFVPLLLYLCADNAEIQYRPVLRDSGAVPHTSQQRSTAPEPDAAPQLASVGEQFAVAMRAYRKQHKDAGVRVVSAGVGSGAKKRPHMRAAHYAHYWVGPKSDPAKRRLILHWISPILVGSKSEPKTVTVADIKRTEKPEA